MTVSKSSNDRKIGQEQMFFNKQLKKGIPSNTENFLVYISERMMNIVAKKQGHKTFTTE